MSYSRIYLDSNILIAAFGGEAAPEVAGPILDMVGVVGLLPSPPFVTSELTLAESLVHAIRNGDERQELSFDNLLNTTGWLLVSPVSRGILWAAASLRARYKHLKLPDAIHVATALAEGCSHVLTADEGIKGSYQVAAARDGMHLIGTNVTSVLRPDRSTLSAVSAWLAS